MKCSPVIRVGGSFWLLPAPLVWMHANSFRKKDLQQKKICKIVMDWMDVSYGCGICQGACGAGAQGSAQRRGKSRLRVRRVGGRGALGLETRANES